MSLGVFDSAQRHTHQPRIRRSAVSFRAPRGRGHWLAAPALGTAAVAFRVAPSTSADAAGPFIPNQLLSVGLCLRSDHDYPSLVAHAEAGMQNDARPVLAALHH